jgi:hypothetical protein
VADLKARSIANERIYRSNRVIDSLSADLREANQTLADLHVALLKLDDLRKGDAQIMLILDEFWPDA